MQTPWHKMVLEPHVRGLGGGTSASGGKGGLLHGTRDAMYGGGIGRGGWGVGMGVIVEGRQGEVVEIGE